jgi:hypothetical protein
MLQVAGGASRLEGSWRLCQGKGKNPTSLVYCSDHVTVDSQWKGKY